MNDVRVEWLREEHLPALGGLFARVGSACFCRYWHFEGTKNEWLDRCAFRPEENERELALAVRAGTPDASGLVALDDAGKALGWMKLAPRAALPKLRRLPVYRSVVLGPDDGVLVVGCFLVDPDSRKSGIATQLLRGGVDHARATGARAIEGVPRRSAEPLHDEEVWQGPEALFRSEGFRAVHDVGPYPIYRLTFD